jgi:hypothetical protein
VVARCAQRPDCDSCGVCTGFSHSQNCCISLPSQATRDPAPTLIDPNDPKGKQQAIHKAESFAEYLAKRKQEGGGAIGSDK